MKQIDPMIVTEFTCHHPGCTATWLKVFDDGGAQFDYLIQRYYPEHPIHNSLLNWYPGKFPKYSRGITHRDLSQAERDQLEQEYLDEQRSKYAPNAEDL